MSSILTNVTWSSHSFLCLVEVGQRILIIALLGFLSSCLTGCGRRSTTSDSPKILLFAGSGTSPNNAPALSHYWENGPQLTGWGELVAMYPDGTPAIVEGSVGDGWVVLSGVHPEAPESWRCGMAFTTSASVDNAYPATLISAAMNRTRLEHY